MCLLKFGEYDVRESFLDANEEEAARRRVKGVETKVQKSDIVDGRVSRGSGWVEEVMTVYHAWWIPLRFSFFSPDIFHRFPFRLRVLSFILHSIRTHPRHCVRLFLFVRLEWMRTFSNLFLL